MSATLPDTWLAKSPETRAFATTLARTALTPADKQAPLWATTTKPIEWVSGVSNAALAHQMAEAVWSRHSAVTTSSPLTLVICNTVDRARALFDALARRVNGPAPSLFLVHSRFRGVERSAWRALLTENGSQAADSAGRIIVATQVVEAGVDLSADLLVTELCPWASLVQRAGRLARRGGSGSLVVFDLEDKAAPPYDADALAAARSALSRVPDASARALLAFEWEHEELRERLYPYDPPHLLLAEEIDELFDTTADLSGGDLDVSRFIREGDERDLSIAWFAPERDERGRLVAPAPDLRPQREATCAVPFLTTRDWLCGKKTGGAEPKRLRAGVSAFVFDYLEGRWRLAQRSDLRPGVTVLVDASVGGYDVVRGFDQTSRIAVPVEPLVKASLQEQTDASADCDDLSQAQWQTIAFHGHAVAVEVDKIASQLDLPKTTIGRLLNIAARWHDLGKAHAAFQGAIGHDERPARTDLAKAPSSAWARGRTPYRVPATESQQPEPRPGFRHELASALAMFDVLRRRAPADHPARLGSWASYLGTSHPRDADAAPPSPIEVELLELSVEEFNLAAYLVCAHHGKLRARLHAGAADQSASVRAGGMPLRGIREGDLLPPTMLSGPDGRNHLNPASQLTLEPAALGLSLETGASWTERVDGLRRTVGPFALAYLEALIRAADVRASADTTLIDPTLSPKGEPEATHG